MTNRQPQNMNDMNGSEVRNVPYSNNLLERRLAESNANDFNANSRNSPMRMTKNTFYM
jgi:hypothetical protein